MARLICKLARHVKFLEKKISDNARDDYFSKQGARTKENRIWEY